MGQVTNISGNDVEVMTYNGIQWVGLNICPLGFANEFSIVCSRADDADGLAELVRKTDRARDAEPGDNYSTRWLSRKELSEHFEGQKDHTGYTYIATADGNAVRV